MMNAALNITVMLFPLMITVITWALYGHHGKRMTRFHISMVQKRSTRKVYTQVLLFFLLIFHYVYSSVHVLDWGVLLSTVFVACLYRFSFSERILQSLNSGKLAFMVMAALTVLMAAVPHLYTLSLTTAFILLASMFYPTKFMVEKYNASMVHVLRSMAVKISFFAETLKLYTYVKCHKVTVRNIINYIRTNMKINSNVKMEISGVRELFSYLNEKSEGRKTKIDAFCDLCDKAASGFISPSIKNPKTDLEPRQCNISISELAAEWKWNRVTVRSFFRKLEEYGQINVQKISHNLIVTMPIARASQGAVKEPHNFYGKLQASASKWVLGFLDDSEFIDIVAQLVAGQIPLTRDSYSEYLLTNRGDANTKNSSSVYEEAQRFAIEYTNKIVMEELVLATFIKVVRSNSFGVGVSMEIFFQTIHARNWSEFLNNLIGLSQLILGSRSNITVSGNKDSDKFLQTYKAILANRLADIVYENAETE